MRSEVAAVSESKDSIARAISAGFVGSNNSAVSAT